MRTALLVFLVGWPALPARTDSPSGEQYSLDALRTHWFEQIKRLRRGYLRFRVTSRAVELPPDAVTPKAEFSIWWDFPAWRVRTKSSVPAWQYRQREMAVDEQRAVAFEPGTGTAWLLPLDEYPSTGIGYFVLLCLPIDPRDRAAAQDGHEGFWLPYCLSDGRYQVRREGNRVVLEKPGRDWLLIDPDRGNAVVERWAYLRFKPGPGGREQLVRLRAEQHVHWGNGLWIPRRGSIVLYAPATAWATRHQARPESEHSYELLEWASEPQPEQLSIKLPPGTRVVDMRAGGEYIVGEDGKLKPSAGPVRNNAASRSAGAWTWSIVALALLTACTVLAYVFWSRKRA